MGKKKGSQKRAAGRKLLRLLAVLRRERRRGRKRERALPKSALEGEEGRQKGKAPPPQRWFLERPRSRITGQSRHQGGEIKKWADRTALSVSRKGEKKT